MLLAKLGSFVFAISKKANNKIIPDDKKNENLNCVEPNHKTLTIEKFIIDFSIFFYHFTSS